MCGNLIETLFSLLSWAREAIEELHSAMENLGSTLYVLKGDPIDIIPRISKNLKADIVSCSADPTDYCRWTSACLAQGGVIARE